MLLFLRTVQPMQYMWAMLFAAMLSISGCATKQQVEPMYEGQLFLPNGQRTTLQEITAAHPQATFYLVGESHTSKCPKLLASNLLATLQQQGKQPLLGLEMLTAKQQHLLDAVNSGAIAQEQFSQHVNWQGTWGYDYSLYEPVIATAYKYNVPIYGLNIPHVTLRKSAMGNTVRVPVDERKWLPSVVIPPLDAQKKMLQEVFLAHQAMRKNNNKISANDNLEKFLRVQSLWDSTMAENAAKLAQQLQRPMVILAGSGHVEFGYGIASRLDVFAPRKQYILFMPTSNPYRLAAEHALTPPAAQYFYYNRPEAAPAMPASMPLPTPKLGIKIQEINGAITVLQVEKNSPAFKAGIKAKDIIVSVNGVAVNSLQGMHAAGKKAHEEKKPMTLDLLRNSTQLTVTVAAK